jgi:hypothetical protein
MVRLTDKTHLEEDISIHIFSVSAAMVGVCLTVIGLIHVVSVLGAANTLADDLLALDSFVFLVSCLLAYWALRTRGSRRMHRLEQIADGLFIFALTVMVVICGIIAYSISFPQTPRRSTPSPITAQLDEQLPAAPLRRKTTARL